MLQEYKTETQCVTHSNKSLYEKTLHFNCDIVF